MEPLRHKWDPLLKVPRGPLTCPRDPFEFCTVYFVFVGTVFVQMPDIFFGCFGMVDSGRGIKV